MEIGNFDIVNLPSNADPILNLCAAAICFGVNPMLHFTVGSAPLLTKHPIIISKSRA